MWRPLLKKVWTWNVQMFTIARWRIRLICIQTTSMRRLCSLVSYSCTLCLCSTRSMEDNLLTYVNKWSLYIPYLSVLWVINLSFYLLFVIVGWLFTANSWWGPSFSPHTLLTTFNILYTQHSTHQLIFMERENRKTRRKTFEAEERTNHKLDSHTNLSLTLTLYRSGERHPSNRDFV
jgi:hypothetical protein